MKVPNGAMITLDEQRRLRAYAQNSADIPNITLLAAHNKLQQYLRTLQPPTPPPSPSYFSDDSHAQTENHEGTLP